MPHANGTCYFQDKRTTLPKSETEIAQEVELAAHAARDHLWLQNGAKPFAVEFDDTLAVVGYN